VSAALDLLAQFRVIGAEIVNRNGRLVLRSERPIPPPMIAAAKLAKDELVAVITGQNAAPEPVSAPAPANRNEDGLEPLLMRDGRRLWRFRAESIPEVLNDADIRPAVEARWCGCTLVADGLDLIVVEPWMSELPDLVRDGLAVHAGTIIALLRGESRVRPGAGKRDGA
jgi:hypothetical protein